MEMEYDEETGSEDTSNTDEEDDIEQEGLGIAADETGEGWNEDDEMEDDDEGAEDDDDDESEDGLDAIENGRDGEILWQVKQ